MKRVSRLLGSPAGFLLTSIVLAPLLVGLLVALGSLVAPGGTPVEPSSTPTVRPTGEDEPDIVPTLVAGGTATQNKAYFDYINKQTIALTIAPLGQNFIDALAAAGFDRASMQLTPDRTAADLDADSIQFSVQIGDRCLIGQWGMAARGYTSLTAPVVTGIGCLIGETRPIDW